MKILTWRDISGNGAFQKPSEIHNVVFSDLITEKPIFTFTFTNLDYIEQNSIYTVDGVPMTDEQKIEVEVKIDSVVVPMSWYILNVKQKLEFLYKKSVEAITRTDSIEMTTWYKQESEARAYTADNTVATPMLNALLLARGLGETLTQLADKIILKADSFNIEYVRILGEYQGKLKQVNSATTVAELLLIK